MAAPISAGLPFGGSGGPRGDPPGPVVLPSRLHREPDGRRPRLGSPPRRPRRRVRETSDASAAGREGVWPGPVRLRRRGTVPEPRNSVLVRPPILLRGRALGTPRHHRYYARPASRGEPRRLSDGEEA